MVSNLSNFFDSYVQLVEVDVWMKTTIKDFKRDTSKKQLLVDDVFVFVQ